MACTYMARSAASALGEVSRRLVLVLSPSPRARHDFVECKGGAPHVSDEELLRQGSAPRIVRLNPIPNFPRRVLSARPHPVQQTSGHRRGGSLLRFSERCEFVRPDVAIAKHVLQSKDVSSGLVVRCHVTQLGFPTVRCSALDELVAVPRDRAHRPLLVVQTTHPKWPDQWMGKSGDCSAGTLCVRMGFVHRLGSRYKRSNVARRLGGILVANLGHGGC